MRWQFSVFFGVVLILFIHPPPLARAIDLPFFGGPAQIKYDNITFWDPFTQKYRGIRVLYYTVLTDEPNRPVDQRLHERFIPMLRSFSQQVITLESFDEETRRRMVENVLVDLVDQWKLEGRVNPEDLFNRLPFLDVDVLVFLERAIYDHIWRGEKKYLMIGLDAAAFEMDFGEPLYNDRLVKEVLWMGEKTSHIKAEREVLVDLANQIGEKFKQVANQINQAHRQEMERQEQARQAEEQARRERLQQERQALKQIVREARQALERAPENSALANLLQQEVDQLEPFINTALNELTNEMRMQRHELAFSIQTHTQQLLENLAPQPERPSPPEPPQPAAQQEQAGNAPPSQPPVTESGGDIRQNLSPVPNLSSPSGNIFDRRWLLPQSGGSARQNSPNNAAQQTRGSALNAVQGIDLNPAGASPAASATESVASATDG